MSGQRQGPESLTVLGLTVEHQGRPTDVIAEVPFGATVAALERALGEALSGVPPDGLDIRVERTGTRLDHEAVVGDCDIRSGDRIELIQRTTRRVPVDVTLRRSRSAEEIKVVTASRQCGPALFELAWEGGSVGLPAGEHVVGSAMGADVVIAEAQPHAMALAVEQYGVAVRALPEGPSVSVDGTVIAPGWHDQIADAEILAGGLRFSVSAVGDKDVDEPGTRLVIGSALPGRRRIDLGAAGEIPFNRPPRASSSWRPLKLELPEPPQPPRRVRIPFAMALVPLVAGGAMALLFQTWYLMFFMLLSPLMAAATYFGDRRSGRKDHREAVERFERRLVAARSQLDAAVSAETHERHVQAPELDALLRRALSHDDRLWERRAWDADFLSLRLGLGRLPAQTEAVLPRTRDGEQDEHLAELAAAHAELDGVPYQLPLVEVGAVGFAGDRSVTADVARAFLLQAVTLHSPAELGVAAVLPTGSEAGWEWLKWLPHSRTGAGMLGGSAIGAGRRAGEVLHALSETQHRRISERESRNTRSSGSEGPALLVLIDEEARPERALVADLLSSARELRMFFIWIGSDPRGLPGQCRITADCGVDRIARVVEIDSGTVRERIRLEGARPPVAARVARALAPVRDAGTTGAAGAIPARLRLIEQLELLDPTADQLAEIWQRPAHGLCATLGATADGPFRVDLRADGPHALIAGTTGAGKSELLRTMVAALAVEHPPSRLAFLLIDYKGGAAFAPCKRFPHVLDVVSDLDAELGERALISLDAEMKRREMLLAEARADNLLDLERRAPQLAPPNLVIMVDEFAKLREEIPEFIDGIVDVAQRGRALGIHMVLAAQSLRSAFTPAVRANTNLRIALRVTSESESEDVVDAPAAARIPSGDTSRGRAFARIGQERLVEFQTAHVSGTYLPPGAAEVLVRPFAFDSVPAPSLRRGVGHEAPPGSDQTDLAALARAAAGATELLGINPPPAAWVPPLPEQVPRSSLQRFTEAAAGRCAVGLIDEPRRQRQVPLLLELERGNVAIYGIGGAGKTTALLTIAAALACDASPEELEIYGVDAEGGGLSVIEPLPHVGAVVSVTDPERLERLLERLEREVNARAVRFAAAGCSTLTEFAARGPWHEEVPPRVVLLLDGYGEFANVFDDARADSPFERFAGLLSSGRGVGVHVVITADRRSAVRTASSSHLPQRIVLRLASRDDLVAFGIPNRVADSVDLVDGRGFTQDGLLAQIALPEPAEGRDVASGFELLGAHLSELWPDRRAPSVDVLPDAIPLHEIAAASVGLDALAVGVGGADLAPLTVDLSERHFLVAGPYDSGRSNVLRVIAEQVAAAAGIEELHLLVPRTSHLVESPVWRSVARGGEACAAAAQELAARVAELPERGDPSLVVVVDDAGELQDAQSWTALERVVRLGRDRGVRLVVGAETSAARMMSNFWIADVRRDGQGLLLAPDLQTDGAILSATLPRRTNVAMVPGRGFLVTRERTTLVQVALAA